MKGLTKYTSLQCVFCDAEFVSKPLLKKHLFHKHQTINESLVHHKCKLCMFSSGSAKDVIEHIRIAHPQKLNKCAFCDKTYVIPTLLRRHVQKRHIDKCTSQNTTFIDTPGSENTATVKKRSIFFAPGEEKSIQACLLINQKDKIRTECTSFRSTYITNRGKRIIEPVFGKLLVCLLGFFIKFSEDGQIVDQHVMPMKTPFRTLTEADIFQFDAFIQWICDRISSARDKLEMVNSGWSFQYVTTIDLEFYKLPSMGSCFNFSLETNIAELFPTKCKYILDYIVDWTKPSAQNQCFFYAVAAGYYKNNLLESTQLHTRENRLIVEEYVKLFQSKQKKKSNSPFKLSSIPHFEKLYEYYKIAINVYTIVAEKLMPLFLSAQARTFKRINLLLLQTTETVNFSIGHYVTITDLCQLGNIIRNSIKEFSHKRYEYVCEFCFFLTTSKQELESHIKFCINKNKQEITFPKKGEHIIEYDVFNKRSRQASFIGFLDFEAKMSPQNNEQNSQTFNCDNCLIGGSVSNCKHSERILHEQIPMTYSLYIFRTCDKKLVYEETYSSDENLMDHFFSNLEKLEKFLLEHLNKYKDKLFWTKRLHDMFMEQKTCHICKRAFIPGHAKWGKVRDHCHMTPPSVVNGYLESKFLGAAHTLCNLRRQDNKTFPIYVHNLMSYDVNFFLKNMDRLQIRNLKAIPYNSNKLRCINIGEHFLFLDSFQILPNSLAELANELAISKNNFDLLKQGRLVPNETLLDLLLRKSVYPYEWVRSVAQLIDTTFFPPRSSFYSVLKGETISESDYMHGKKVYDSTKCKNMLDYTELYCKLDTLLLAEIVFSYRDTVLDYFNIPIENYISTPQITWDACMKTIKKPLELITDETFCLQVERSLRGGVSFVNNRHETDNNGKDTILYLDATNLYGFAQSLYLPTGKYTKIPIRTANILNWAQMQAAQPIGYILEVTLEFPKHLHEYFDDLPLAPFHDVITYEKLSAYSQSTCNYIKGEKKAKKKKDHKLISSVELRERYVVHYLSLGFYLRQGAILREIHSCTRFEQEPYLLPYIKFISRKRAESKSEFEKRLLKLLVNSLYGKFIQDVRKYCKVIFVYSDKKLKKLISNPFFVTHMEVAPGISLVFLRKAKVRLNRMYAVGFSILELSKLHMYTLWYEELKPRFGNQMKLLLTDTDSFVIKFSNISKLNVLEKIRHIIDFSNFPPDHPFYSTEIKKVPGYLKDEYPNNTITEVVAVKSKCYFLRFKEQNQKSHIVCKGISKKVSDTFPIDLYKQCVYQADTIVKSSMTTIRAKKYNLRTIMLTKVCMTSGDDKRFQTCAIHSVPYGSKYAVNDKCIKCETNEINN